MLHSLPPLFLYSKQLMLNIFLYKNCPKLDFGPHNQLLEATAMPTTDDTTAEQLVYYTSDLLQNRLQANKCKNTTLGNYKGLPTRLEDQQHVALEDGKEFQLTIGII